MNITFLEEASHEFSAAVGYYDSQELGLGQRFEDEIDRALNWLAENPQACSVRRGIYRRKSSYLSVLFPTLFVNRLYGLSLLRNRTDGPNTGSKGPRASVSPKVR